MTIWTGLAGVVWLVLRAGRGLYPEMRYQIALATLLALPLSLAADPVLNRVLPAVHPSALQNQIGSPISISESVENPGGELIAVVEASSHSQERLIGSVRLLTFSWLLGLADLSLLLFALWGIAGLSRSAWSLRRFRRSLTPSSSLQTVVDDLRRRYAVKRPVGAAMAPSPTTPFTFGWRHPVVVVPDLLDGNALHLALSHEFAHLRRHDFAFRFIEAMHVAVFGWHPLVRALCRQINAERECLCDAEVLSRDSEKRRAYADLLFTFADTPTPSLALSIAPHSSFLSKRIEAMKTLPISRLHTTRYRRTARILGLAIFVLTVSIAGLSTAATLPDEQPRAMNPALSSSTETRTF